MSGYDEEGAGVYDEKVYEAYKDDVDSPVSWTPVDEWSQEESEKASLVWTFNKTPIRLGKKASPRQNITVAKFIFIAILVTFSILNLTQVCSTIHSRRKLQVEQHFEKQLDEEVPSKAVVMASFRDQNVSWALEIPDDWRIYRYLSNDNTVVPRKPPAGQKLTHQDTLYRYTHTVPRNQGREAMAYLTFIIDNYYRLPLFTAFIHGHERSWHQVEPMQLRLQSINLTDVAEKKFASFRCYDVPCNPENRRDLTANPEHFHRPPLRVLPEFWRLIFPDEPLPTDLQSPMTAQLVVPRSVILARPLEYWINLRRPLLRDLHEYFAIMPHLKPCSRERGINWVIGLMYEHIWHIAFSQPNRWCPTPDHCRKTTFSNTITCDVFPRDWWSDPELKNTTCVVDDAAVARAAAAQNDAVKVARAELLREMMAG